MKVIRPFHGGYPGHLDLRFVLIKDGEKYRKIDPVQDMANIVFMDHFRYRPSMKKMMPNNTK